MAFPNGEPDELWAQHYREASQRRRERGWHRRPRPETQKRVKLYVAVAALLVVAFAIPLQQPRMTSFTSI